MSEYQPTVPGDVPNTMAENELGAIDPSQTTGMRDTEGEVAEDVAHQVLESDPNGNGPHGLSGDMGVSSERRGEPMGSSVESTHGTQSVTAEAPTEPGAEWSGGAEETNPADVPSQRFDPGTATPHSHG